MIFTDLARTLFYFVGYMFQWSLPLCIFLPLLFFVFSLLGKRASSRVFGFILNAVLAVSLFSIVWEREDPGGLLRDFLSLFGIHAEPLIRIGIPHHIVSRVQGIPGYGAWGLAFFCSVIWYAGFLLVDRKKDRQALKFQRQIAREAVDHTEDFRQYIELISPAYPFLYDTKVTVLIWDKAETPFATTANRVVLPNKTYTDEELELILRHEFGHLALHHPKLLDRLDTVCRICWFNPLVWLLAPIVRRRMELACDDLVLNGVPEKRVERVTYARLLVDMAEQKQLSGAALYLSAGAELIRERTSEILNPTRTAKILSAILLLAVTFTFPYLLGTGIHVDHTPLEAVAMLGNFDDKVTMGLALDYGKYILIDDDSMKAETNRRGAITELNGTWEGDTPEEQAALYEKSHAWVRQISDALGIQPELSYSTSNGKPSGSVLYYEYRWPIELTKTGMRELRKEESAATLLLKFNFEPGDYMFVRAKLTIE